MILIWTCIFTFIVLCLSTANGVLMNMSQIFVQKIWIKLFIKYKYYFVSFLDLNDCFALTEIGSLKNTQTIGICVFVNDVPFSTIENCKTYCLRNSRCFGVEHTVPVSYAYCILYMYEATTSRCYFSRGASHFFHKGNHIVSNVSRFKPRTC